MLYYWSQGNQCVKKGYLGISIIDNIAHWSDSRWLVNNSTYSVQYDKFLKK